MNFFQSVMLGVIQGLTEFLPVSSSGHLVLFQRLFGLKEPELLFDVCLHIGSLVAVIIFFRKDIWAIIVSVIRSTGLVFSSGIKLQDLYKDPDFKMAVLIIAGSVPTALIGFFLQKVAERLFSSIILVGFMLIATGIVLFLTGVLIRYKSKMETKEKDINGFLLKDSLIIGIIQGMAIIPGISRSGTTIAIGLFLGLDKETAARYSFLLSIPAIFGAGLLTLKDLPAEGGNPIGVILTGTLVSCIVGYFALKFLVYIVKQGNLYLFAPYCWIVGLITLFVGW
ncbi:MAG: undecaprenyl-diphosphate phosphatase [Desulfobacterales bacterium]|jgi:undecaprenyl-diphosphatase|nr:undecaprenyl-diphosphate phosphatase [Desulfobacteraceae bacterium]MBT4363712.1 undecaprenyl-diphosphate phosphatase [Desulfobacteraceae bacterium]MBT7087141.1 undecaprenyl-diphosphate phosphatase [Desulfobacterales bacterium]MBT7696503.1 undecaprenyl-diphosphate phosphatase [Desulfobacterales bacterium]